MDARAPMAAPLFLASWTVMMAAMMFPAAAPMIVAFGAVHARRRGPGGAVVSAWTFCAGYLLVWVGFGMVGYAAASGFDHTLGQVAWVRANNGRLLGALLALAGLYQLSPLKRACLGRCQSPLAFIATSWRNGPLGAVRMGVQHGLLCVGCCWLLFAIMFPVGVMNLAMSAGLTLVVFAEKALAAGRRVADLVGLVLVAAGIVVALAAPALPSTM
jgi:predicted metal-binding membrane protein